MRLYGGGVTIRVPKYAVTEKFVEWYNENHRDNTLTYKVLSNNNFDENFIYENIKKTVNMIKKLYHENQIIINEAYLLKQYIDNSLSIKNFGESNYIDKINEHLSMMYKVLKNELPDAHIIKMPENTLGEINHIWGLGNVHAHISFYQYALDCVDIICKKNRLNTLEGAYLCQCRENLFRKSMIEMISR